MNFKYIEDPETIYYWTKYVTSEDIPEVTDDVFNQLTQATKSNRGQQVGGGGGGSHQINKRDENRHWFLTNESWKVMTKYQNKICMDLSESNGVFRTRSVNPRPKKKYCKGGTYGGISHEYGNNPRVRKQANNRYIEEYFGDKNFQDDKGQDEDSF